MGDPDEEMQDFPFELEGDGEKKRKLGEEGIAISGFV